MGQRAFGMLLIAAAAALWIGAYAQYRSSEPSDDERLACLLAATSSADCEEDPNSYTGNWVAAGIGGVLFSAGVLVAATGGTRTVRLEGQQPAGAAPPPKDESLASALAELDALRGNGLVSDDEYAAKRTEILGRL